MIYGNKGEWSELYTLFKILSDKVLFAGDSDLNKIENLVFPIIEILRMESGQLMKFSYDGDIVLIMKNCKQVKIPISHFTSYSKILFQEIQNNKRGTFSVAKIESEINNFGINSIKASSKGKKDISVIIHDARTGKDQELGFSIKSRLGHPSTLFNAAKTTNFIYKIDNISPTDDIINSINSFPKIRDRINQIVKLGGKFSYNAIQNSTFENNLKLIDSSLDYILAAILFIYYSTGTSILSDIIELVKKQNPLFYNTKENHPYYEYKVKRFLTDTALGMVPGTVWTGDYDATGGYLIVREDGEIICYHIYNKAEFENYLLNNTRLDTPSSSRHEFGILYKVNDHFFFNMNLQIRFKK